MPSYKILTDADVEKHLDMQKAIVAIEQALIAQSQGRLVAPPRFNVNFANYGALVFTVGGMIQGNPIAGFRVYDTFKGDSPDREQFVAVFDVSTGAFKGIVIGEMIGAMRTGAIGGVAIKLLSNESASSVGIIGSGLQARTQLMAATTVRKINKVHVFSRSAENRRKFADEMSRRLEVAIVPMDSAESAVRGKDIVICATNSSEPVIDPNWISLGAHVNTVGPKFKGRNELDASMAALAEVIATDSIEQIKSYTKPFFLSDTSEMNRIVELDQVLGDRRKGRQSAQAITLFCSSGLAGTEVIVANTLF